MGTSRPWGSGIREITVAWHTENFIAHTPMRLTWITMLLKFLPGVYVAGNNPRPVLLHLLTLLWAAQPPDCVSGGRREAMASWVPPRKFSWLQPQDDEQALQAVAISVSCSY